MSVPEAKAYLDRHEAQLLGIVEKIERCLPMKVKSGSQFEIRSEGATEYACTSEDKSVNIAGIQSDLRKADVIALKFLRGYEGDSIRFRLYGAGTVMASTETSIVYVYYAGDPPEASKKIEIAPLRPQPTHWYWERWST
jgi:hypothetical protein